MSSHLSKSRRVVLSGTFLDGHVWSFEAEIPLPSGLTDIDIAVAKRLNGAALESIPNSTYGFILAYSTLDYVVRTVPDDFPETFNSFQELEDPEFVIELYNDYRRQEEEYRSSLKKNRGTRSTKRRGNTSRSVSDGSPETLPEGRRDSRRSVHRTEEVHSRSDGEIGLSEIHDESEAPIATTPSKGNVGKGVSGFHQPRTGTYPGKRDRVLERDASP